MPITGTPNNYYNITSNKKVKILPLWPFLLNYKHGYIRPKKNIGDPTSLPTKASLPANIYRPNYFLGPSHNAAAVVTNPLEKKLSFRNKSTPQR